ncbi:MAG TPA: methyltransferase [Caulobacter sp.]|nr:methyltransferase [Caulobacter sp.]
MTSWSSPDWRGKFDPAAALRLDTRLSSDRELREDRAHELAEFMRLSPEQVKEAYRAHHELRSIPLKTIDESSIASVEAAYADRMTLNWLMTQCMLHHTRLEDALQLLLAMRRVTPHDRPLRVIDFGCGAADFGLLFALNGAEVTLVDLERGILPFAAWRLKRRGLNVRTVAVRAEDPYPALPKADLVIAGDVLEYLIDPPASIRHIHEALNPGGLFWFPGFPYQMKMVADMRTQLAADLRQSALDAVGALFSPVAGPRFICKAKPFADLRQSSPEANIVRRLLH